LTPGEACCSMLECQVRMSGCKGQYRFIFLKVPTAGFTIRRTRRRRRNRTVMPLHHLRDGVEDEI
jgi:hypothetical protein